MECEYVRHGAGSVWWGRRLAGARTNCTAGQAAAAAETAAPAHLCPHTAVGAAYKLLASERAVRDRDPFMSNMDGISYWICTRRAPCLLNYDNIIKKQNEEVHGSKAKPKSVPSIAKVPSPRKKKNKKLSLLEENSLSEKPQNVYFDTSQRCNKKTLLSDCETDTGSDIDFNIKNSSVQAKPRRKQPRNRKTILHKKISVATSTPKVSKLRRSLRQAQQSLNNNTQLNSSFEIFNADLINGNNLKCTVDKHKLNDDTKKQPELLAGGHQSVEKTTPVNNTLKNDIHNGQFEDLSDVSGFTANYIRSTKLQTTKTPRKLRCKNSRTLVKESQTSIVQDNTIVCGNKSTNAQLSKGNNFNCSTDSSQIVINLVTSKSNEKTPRANKSTSVLKFRDTRTSKSRESVTNSKLDGNKKHSKANLNISFESQNSTTSRYPKRYMNNITYRCNGNNGTEVSHKGNKKTCKQSTEFHDSDLKQTPVPVSISKTRSGRSIRLALQADNSVLVQSNSTDQISSMASINVATLGEEQREKTKRKRRTTRQSSAKKSLVNSAHLQADSLKDKSGFAACFSDSDGDSEPLKRRKFFCA